jgi:hypothetical protein
MRGPHGMPHGDLSDPVVIDALLREHAELLIELFLARTRGMPKRVFVDRVHEAGRRCAATFAGQDPRYPISGALDEGALRSHARRLLGNYWYRHRSRFGGDPLWVLFGGWLPSMLAAALIEGGGNPWANDRFTKDMLLVRRMLLDTHTIEA